MHKKRDFLIRLKKHAQGPSKKNFNFFELLFHLEQEQKQLEIMNDKAQRLNVRQLNKMKKQMENSSQTLDLSRPFGSSNFSLADFSKQIDHDIKEFTARFREERA